MALGAYERASIIRAEVAVNNKQIFACDISGYLTLTRFSGRTTNQAFKLSDAQRNPGALKPGTPFRGASPQPALGKASEHIPFLFLFVQHRPFPHQNRQVFNASQRNQRVSEGRHPLSGAPPHALLPEEAKALRLKMTCWRRADNAFCFLSEIVHFVVEIDRASW